MRFAKMIYYDYDYYYPFLSALVLTALNSISRDPSHMIDCLLTPLTLSIKRPLSLGNTFLRSNVQTHIIMYSEVGVFVISSTGL